MRIVAEVFGMIAGCGLVFLLAPPTVKVIVSLGSQYLRVWLPKEKSDDTGKSV